MVEIPPRPRPVKRMSQKARLVLIFAVSLAGSWTLLGVPNFLDFLMDRTVYPQWPFDYWWMWMMK